LTDQPENRWRRWGFLRQIKLNAIRVARIKSSPDAVARGIALGVFIGFTPFFGFHIAIALVCAFLLRQNKIATFAGVWVTNPLTAPPIYYLEYSVGRMLLAQPAPGYERFNYELIGQMIKENNWEIMRYIGAPWMLGSLVLGIPAALICYALTFRLIPSLRQYKFRRWPRRLRRFLPGEEKDNQP
jgi:uncharacterized protein (DUF2062 family)